jgi:hypothetical protein
MIRSTTKFIRHGRYAAEIPVELIDDHSGWSPYLSVDDAEKLDAVRKALREGDVASATAAPCSTVGDDATLEKVAN